MNTIHITCAQCGQASSVERALFVWCPDCPARAGQPCMNLRAGSRRPIQAFHAGRRAAARTGDPVRMAG